MSILDRNKDVDVNINLPPMNPPVIIPQEKDKTILQKIGAGISKFLGSKGPEPVVLAEIKGDVWSTREYIALDILLTKITKIIFILNFSKIVLKILELRLGTVLLPLLV